MRLPADCRLTFREALMEAVSIAVRDGHGRALSAYVAGLDVIGYKSTRPVEISTGRYDWSLLSALQHMATGEAITQSTADDAIRRHGYARQLAAKTPLDRLGLEDRACLAPQQRFSAGTRMGIRRAGGRRMTCHRNPADRALGVCVERLCAALRECDHATRVADFTVRDRSVPA